MIAGFCYLFQARQICIDKSTELPLRSAMAAAPPLHASVLIHWWILPSSDDRNFHRDPSIYVIANLYRQ